MRVLRCTCVMRKTNSVPSPLAAKPSERVQLFSMASRHTLGLRYEHLARLLRLISCHALHCYSGCLAGTFINPPNTLSESMRGRGGEKKPTAWLRTAETGETMFGEAEPSNPNDHSPLAGQKWSRTHVRHNVLPAHSWFVLRQLRRRLMMRTNHPLGGRMNYLEQSVVGLSLPPFHY